MKAIARPGHSIIILLIIVLFVFFFATCINHTSEQSAIITNHAREQFAGSASCAGCHKDIYDNHINTAHYLTSRLASGQSIKGSFQPPQNSYGYDANTLVAMEKQDSGLFQVEYVHGSKKTVRRFDIVFGSGQMGQTYLSWVHDNLYQLPITFFSAANQWSNSPGFPNRPVFNRPITSRCFECHSTYAKVISPPEKRPEAFDRTKMIYGVDCEKCHGPAARHVDFQTKQPLEKTAKFIINPAKLSRQQNLDLCASCHGGSLSKTTASFSFAVGDKLEDHFVLDGSVPNPNNIDVHGNQYGLLRASKCFRESETMTCNSCHNSHEKERGKLAIYSQRCMTCHNTDHGSFCKMEKTIGASIKNNCIDCHMPLKPSRAIAVFLPGGKAPTAALIRSHFIGVYPDEAKKLNDFIQHK